MPFEECQPACDSAAMRAFPSLGLSKIVKHPQDKYDFQLVIRNNGVMGADGQGAPKSAVW
ncbi:hypothetical protein C0Q70_11495 [Pomacea canaliculata]|uniref:Uncharacterized protein n=1 Tax=Pomacea canaliculata TaxID=400727 RepID=A0A2T7P655_POMCA|nr:hypothetical protein C0Q70_11495 [Pomacea canaliculata]